MTQEDAVYQRILVAMDGSDTARRGLKAAT